jgi:TetR/AcrR family transcriptional regulator
MPAPDRRRQLLEAALEAFSRKGFEGATTKEIAEAAGVTEGVVFRHFPSKQALYAAVLEHQDESRDMREWLERLQFHMDRNDDAGVLGTIAAGILTSYRADVRFERLMLFAALEGHEQGLAHHRLFALPLFERLQEYFTRRQQDGALRGNNAAAVITAIAGMSQYYAMMTQMFGYGSSLGDDEVVEAFTAIVLNGIVPSSVTPEKGNS